MKLHVFADLHLEFGSVEIPATDADVVVCAGDVHPGTRGVEWLASQFPEKPVSGVPLWLRGHTQYNVDYKLGSTRVLTNQRGYPTENRRSFKPGMIVEV